MPTPVVTKAAVNGGGFNTILLGSPNTLVLEGTDLHPRPAGDGLLLWMAGLGFSNIRLDPSSTATRATYTFDAASTNVFGLGSLRIVVINTDGGVSATRILQVTYLADTLLHAPKGDVQLSPVRTPDDAEGLAPTITTAVVNDGAAIRVGDGVTNILKITGTGFSGPRVLLGLNPSDLDFPVVQITQWSATAIESKFEARFHNNLASDSKILAVGQLTVTVVNDDGTRVPKTIQVLYPEPPTVKQD